ncbi:MAG: hypothetical protein GY698_21595 [Actinomycetia bacterium]|nr:hypothetical protein [Actinomycetes bacterium]
MSDIDAITKLAVRLGEALGMSESVFATFSTDDLGIALPETVTTVAGVGTALGHAETAARTVADAATALEAAALSGSDTQQLAAYIAFGTSLGAYFAAVANLVSAVNSAITAGSIPDANDRAAAQALVAELGKRLADLVILSAVDNTIPELNYLLKLLGLVDWSLVRADTSTQLGVDHIERHLHLGRLKTLFTDPAAHFQTAFQWGAAGFDPTDFFEIWAQFFPREAGIVIDADSGDPFMKHGKVRVARDSSVTPPGLSVDLSAGVKINEQIRVPFGDAWGLNIGGELTFTGGASALIEAPAAIEATTSADATGEMELFFDREDSAGTLDLLAGNGLITLTIEKISAGVGLEANWDIVAGVASVEPLLFAAIKGAKLGIGSDDADDFIGELLSSADIEGNFDLTVEWSASDGLRVQGSGGFEIKLAVHKAIGPLKLDSLYIAMRVNSAGTLELETSAAVTAKLGPLSAAVDRVGAQLELDFVDDTSGGLGLFDLDLGFKPPSGVGLSIDAAVVNGGGYLDFDPEKEQYAGAMELVLLEFVTVKAIGLVTTRMPDGSKGFSLLLIITAEFGDGIQLGLGFKLIGVGGLLGLNRTMQLQPLMEGVRTGAIQSVMFPKDVVANAPRIISDLRKFFPPKRDVFLIGPMAKIGWGTPTLITLSMGVIIEIPGNIAIVGVLKVNLPDEKAPLIKLQVNFVGAIEFDKKQAWFFAGLFESRVLMTTLEGEMGVLVRWGNNTNFVVSVGGFHPQFKPPPLPFKGLKRIMNTILDSGVARIRIEGYFAVTSNTVQFGARAEMYFGISIAKVEGHIAFDALFQFNPFYFIIQISASVSVKFFGIGLFSVSLRFSLEGPTPWRAKGYGKIKILFWSKKVKFDITWGPRQDTSLPPVKVMPILEAEFTKNENWRALVPKSNSLSVSLRALDTASGDLVLHPLGVLGVSQRAIPLDIELDKVGSRRPSDADRFTLTLQGGLSKRKDLDESFAIGQFKDLKDADKLSKPSFQPLGGGLEAAPSDRTFEVGNVTKRNVRYETVIIDRQRKKLRFKLSAYIGTLFAHFVNGNAASQAVVSKKSRDQFTPFDEKIEVVADGYAVTFSKDNTAYNAQAVFSSQAKAETFLADEITKDPALAGSLQVISSFELVGAS